MRVYVLLLVGLISIHSINGQEGGRTESDSLERMKQFEQALRKREVQKRYNELYANDRRSAVEWRISEEKDAGLVSGEDRLSFYQNHTRIDTLKEIDLSYADLKEVPDFVFAANSLEILILDYNSIKKLPKELGELPHLKRVYWRANNLDSFWWIHIQKIKDLEKLDISNNLLTRLPNGIKKLEGLKELVVGENFFGEVPVKRLAKADFLETVSFNKSHDIDLGLNNYGRIDFLKVLKLNNCGISQIDPSLYQLNNLNELQLQENDLMTVPTGISQMNKLTKLSFYKNQITSLPEDLFDLNLKVIDLYYNQLEVIPESFGNLKDLEILFLAYNHIYSLPESMGKLDKLEELYLHHNRLSVLPQSLAHLDRLRVIRINNNFLSEFPSQFLDKSGLTDLDVSHNQLATLPEELSKLEKLRLFTYQENEIDFNLPGNSHVAPMIYNLIESGVICVPRVYAEEVMEPAPNQ